MEYEYLSHTADVKLRAYGKNFEDACRSAARGFTDLLTDVHKIELKEERRIAVRAGRKDALLYDFINELIYHKDVSGFVAAEAKLALHQQKAVWELSGTLRGDLLAGYEHSGDVKAATYHDMHVTETNDGTTLEIVLDI